MKLHYKTFGSGKPIIILHGLFGMLDNWRSIARSLEDQYQCILVDLRNHGKSPDDPEMNYKVMANDIAELMATLHLNETHIWGHSMGGKVAMQFALDHSEKVNTLVVIDISPGAYPPHHDEVLAAIESIDTDVLTERSQAEDRFRSYLADDEATIQFLMKNLTRKQEGGFEWKANMPVLIAEYDQLMNSINSDRSFDKPTLFIRGAKSNSLKDEDMPLIKKLFPRAEIITIPDAGHWVHADQPQALTESILSFMKAGQQ